MSLSHRQNVAVLKHTIKRRITRNVLTRAVAFRTRRLIVFLTPGYDCPSGGILSIASIYRESAEIRDLHGAKVALCTVPGESPLLKYTWFENRNYLLDLDDLLKRCNRLDFLLLHIPEYAVNETTSWLKSRQSTLLRSIREVHLNVLVQNIDLVQGQHLAGLMRFGKVTCTTAHEAYTNSTTRERLGVPLHRLSCCNGPELYTRSGYHDKEQILIVSGDDHPLKARVLEQVERQCPELKIRIIQNMVYENYLELVRRSKWSLTFGEGLDAYFVDPVFSGGVSFAVFNDRFFTPAFASLETVYPSWDELLNKMTADLQRLDEPNAYERCSQQTNEILSSLYSTQKFRENLCRFYTGEYTFP